uniref:G-protein coupled receptors family 1 profile domain-containing protein n=1 Tax=Leptobrachium leishanense TaxID=445787 RepID=A0A8C5QTV6_9ANUR
MMCGNGKVLGTVLPPTVKKVSLKKEDHTDVFYTNSSFSPEWPVPVLGSLEGDTWLPPMSNNSNCADSRQRTEIFTSGYSIILLLGLFLNVIALYFFFRLPQLRSPTTIYMKNLAFTDLILVCTLPLRIYDYAETNPLLPQWLCRATGILFLLNIYGSVFLLAGISLDRCLAVCFPLRSKMFRHHAPWICAGLWVFNIITCFTFYYITSKNNPTENDNNCPCYRKTPTFVKKIGPALASIVSGFFVPLGIMTVSSWALLKAVGRSRLTQTGLVNKWKIVRMLVTNLTIYLFCFLPYHIVLLLYQILGNNQSLDDYYRIALLVACSNAVLDPLAYYFAAETLQRTMVKEMRLVGESEVSAEKIRTSGSLSAKGS